MVLFGKKLSVGVLEYEFDLYPDSQNDHGHYEGRKYPFAIVLDF